MLEQNLEIIRAVLKNDPTITPPQRREYIGLLVNGKPAPQAPACDVPRVIRRREAALRLGRTTRSIDQLCRQGVLKKVVFPGRKRSGGILESSLLSAING